MPTYEDITPEGVKADIIANYHGGLDTRDGSFFDFLISPVALEISKLYSTMDVIFSVLFPDETSGAWIDEAASAYGIVRKPGTCATAEITFTGADGTVIPAGTSFYTGDGQIFTLNGDVTLADGTGTGQLTAQDPGARGNVDAGAVKTIYMSVPGLRSFIVGAASGGTDAETDAALFARYIEQLQNPSHSGSEADYRRWALSVKGVDAVYVLPRWAGPWTVKVLVASYAGEVSPETLEAVRNTIETERPVGVTVTVAAAERCPIDVMASVALTGGVTLPEVREAFTALLADYLADMGLSGGAVSFNKAAYLLMSVRGVTDYTVLSLNGGSTSVTLEPGVLPVMGTVTLTEAAS